MPTHFTQTPELDHPPISIGFLTHTSQELGKPQLGKRANSLVHKTVCAKMLGHQLFRNCPPIFTSFFCWELYERPHSTKKESRIHPKIKPNDSDGGAQGSHRVRALNP